MPEVASLPPEAWCVALTALPEMGPARLRAVLGQWAPEQAWRRVASGRAASVRAVAEALGPRAASLPATWARAAADLDPATLWRRHVDQGVGVSLAGSPSYPACLAGDPEPPAVLFHRGDPDVASGPRVAVVGTRTCTRYGLDVARELGHDLAAAGVRVVSGLALGIDGAAHRGAIEAAGAPPVGVVGSGLDVVYPRAHRRLWETVERDGALYSEAALGAQPAPWRFPARNRIIAGLADLVVVVESGERGGALHTVAEAARRDRPVMAVPGPVRSAASAGTNRLLAEGCAPVCDIDDVLCALGLSPGGRRPDVDPRTPPTAEDEALLEAMGWRPTTLDALSAATGRPLPTLALAVARLADAGWLECRGAWYERIARPEP